MKSVLTILVCFFTALCVNSQRVYDKHVDVIIKNDSSFFDKHGQLTYMGIGDTILVSKDVILEKIADFDQLYEICRDNFSPTLQYVRDIARTYNDHRNYNTTASNVGWNYLKINNDLIPRIDFFNSHNVVQPGNMYKPSDSSVFRNNYINFQGYTYEYYKGTQFSGERNIAYFTFGKGPVYKKGILYGNLAHIFKSDPKSNGLFKKYKNRIYTRTAIHIVGYALLGIALDAFLGNRITNMSEDFAIAPAIVGVFMANFHLFSKKSRLVRKFIFPAITTYNENVYRKRNN